MVDERVNAGRRQLMAIVAIATLSLGGAYALFYVAQEGAVWGTTNHGEFVVPPRTVADTGVTDPQSGQPPENGSWWLWVMVEEHCGAGCDDTLFQLRQLHVLLNKDADRLQRALVTAADVSVAPQLDRYPGLRHLLHRSLPPEMVPGVYIVDPLGNLVLFYPHGDVGKPVLEDLKRLLKLSRIG